MVFVPPAVQRSLLLAGAIHSFIYVTPVAKNQKKIRQNQKKIRNCRCTRPAHWPRPCRHGDLEGDLANMHPGGIKYVQDCWSIRRATLTGRGANGGHPMALPPAWTGHRWMMFCLERSLLGSASMSVCVCAYVCVCMLFVAAHLAGWFRQRDSQSLASTG